MKLPLPLLESLRGLPGYDEAAFLETHREGRAPTSIRINPARTGVAGVTSLDIAPYISESVPWSGFGYFLRERPSFTFDPEFHGGCYYVQEASSMLLEEVLRQWGGLSGEDRALDLSAAPGGKSTHLQSLLSPGSLLVSNEVIRSRTRILGDQLVKWGAVNTVITQNDPRDFDRLPGFFDLLLIDAPCSGSGLFRRDAAAVEEWSPQLVQLCAGRQQRIVTDAWPCLREGGLLVYSTCSYSREENEEVSAWILENFPVEEMRMDIPAAWRITAAEKGYRIWPGQSGGEGFYFAAFRKCGGASRAPKMSGRVRQVAKEVEKLVGEWLPKEHFFLTIIGDSLHALPAGIAGEMSQVTSTLRSHGCGLRLGNRVRDTLVPAHDLALSGLVKEDIRSVLLEKEEAIAYLGRRDFAWPVLEKGWHLVLYRQRPLGWIKSLGNRINNYYPQHLRILKEAPR